MKQISETKDKSRIAYKRKKWLFISEFRSEFFQIYSEQPAMKMSYAFYIDNIRKMDKGML